MVGTGLKNQMWFYKESTQTLLRIMEGMKPFEKEPLIKEALSVLPGLAQESFRLTKTMRERQEHMDEFSKFVHAINVFFPEDRQFLMDLRKSKLGTVRLASV